jgi:formylglycine-generating enzyme required for sulfatase activity
MGGSVKTSKPLAAAAALLMILAALGSTSCTNPLRYAILGWDRASRNGLYMTYVQGGTFIMGKGDWIYPETKPAHPVTVSDFWMSCYEVTREAYYDYTGGDPSFFYGVADLPVERVSWLDAVKFCNLLSEDLGLTPCYTIDTVNERVDCNFNVNGFRLPTEAEWEFAARGGVDGSGYQFSGSNNLDTVAWNAANTTTTKPVGTKAANELGLYDMTGNVWEFCWDHMEYAPAELFDLDYDYDNTHPPTVDPTGWYIAPIYYGIGSYFQPAIRGSSFADISPDTANVAFRAYLDYDPATIPSALQVRNYVGFRVVRRP